MGKKVNIWLDDATLRLWEKIPTGERSSIIKGAIRDEFEPIKTLSFITVLYFFFPS